MKQVPLVRETVVDKLREQIYSMRTDSLVRICSERLLAENLGVSRVSLRSALKELVKEGLLVQLRGKGTYITPKTNISTVHILVCS